jgi:hypothetical protein
MSKLGWSVLIALGLATQHAAAQAPGAAEPPAPEPSSESAWPAAPTDETSDSTSFDAQLVGGLATLGVGLGFVVAFNYAFFRVNDLLYDPGFVSYRKGISKGESSCELARQGVASTRADASSPADVASQCDEVDSMLILRNVALPIGLVASIVGTVLIGTSDTVVGPEQARNWDVRLNVGGGGAELGFVGRF